MMNLREALCLEDKGVVSLVGAGGKTSLMFRLAAELSGAGETVLTTTTTRIMMPTRKQSPRVILATSPEAVLSSARELLAKNRHVSAASPRPLEIPGKIAGFMPQDVDRLWDSGLFRWILVEADGAAQKPFKVPADHEPVLPVSTCLVIGVVGLRVLGKPLDESHVFRHERCARITGLLPGDLITEASIAAAALHENGIFKDTPSHARKILFLNGAGYPEGHVAGMAVARFLIAACQEPAIERVVVGKPLETPSVIAIFDIQNSDFA
ncbi:MAG: selenium cofactor biosynthesis protein YqeC [Desulfatirhabdiaceae bacterium]